QSSTTVLSTLSLHDALPIYDLSCRSHAGSRDCFPGAERPSKLLHNDKYLEDGMPAVRAVALICACFLFGTVSSRADDPFYRGKRSEEHTSELQSLAYLVCRL